MVDRAFLLFLITCVCGVGLSCASSRQDDTLPPGSVLLQGAGATFPAPLYKTWIEAYEKRHPAVLLNYKVVGSGEGTEVPSVMPGATAALSYPIVTYSWLLLYKRYDDPQQRAALKRFVQWCLTEGQAFNEPLGYLRLPPHVVTRGLEAV